MPVTSAIELGAALSAPNFDQILGTEEGDWIDFKTGPYSMQGSGNIQLTEVGRWELCKDVAAVANNRGGYLVLGVRTEKQPLIGLELATEIAPIRTSLIDIEAYRATISAGIYPPPQGIAVRWYLDSEDSGLGLLLIEIPPQPEHHWPFLTRRLFDCEDRSVQGFGLPTRNGDQIDWTSVEGIHAQIRSMPHGVPIVNHIDDAGRVSSDELIDSVILEKGWENRPSYFLQARPSPLGPDIEGFYNQNGPAQSLQDPTTLRPNGFNLRVFGTGEYGDRGLAFRGREHSYLELDRNGVFTLGVLAEPMVLGWAVNNRTQPDEPIRINPAVLIELTAEFCRFVESDIKEKLQGREIVFEVRCKNFRQFNVRLMPGLPRLHWLFQSNWQANESDLSVSIVSGDSAMTDAFRILSAVYGHFNLGSDQIPLTSDGLVDEDLIRGMQ
jgi:hypothetical protein